MRRIVLAALAVLGAGCGLISSDVDDFALGLPEEEFAVDSANWRLTVTQIPSLSCSMVDCAQAAATFCAEGGCTSECGQSGACQVSVDVSIYQTFNLLERPELRALDEKQGIRVTVDSVSFRVDENTFEPPRATPPIDVYMAPLDVTDASSPEAKKVGTIAALPPRFTGEGDVEFSADGRGHMEAFMESFRTPFNVILKGTITFAAGETVPTGRVKGVITARARADSI